MTKKIKYQNINVSEKNKKELEVVKHELERFHKRDFRLDFALGHVLKIYKATMKILKDKEKYLQKL